MELLSLALLIGLLAIAYTRLPKKGKEPEYLVHIQGRTEQDEHMDFAVSLFKGESFNEWKRRMDLAARLIEDRRKFNNDRVLEIMKKAQEENEKKKAEEVAKNVALKLVDGGLKKS